MIEPSTEIGGLRRRKFDRSTSEEPSNGLVIYNDSALALFSAILQMISQKTY
jgi:hypothetical protein